MKKLALMLLFLMIIPAIALGGDYVRFDDQTITGSPKMIFRADRADLTANPALLGEGSTSGFIFDTYYLGSTTKVSSDYLNLLDDGLFIGHTTGYSDGRYISNGFGTDLGYVMKLGDASTLGFIFNYDFSYMEGNENFFDYWDDGRGGFGRFYGATERKVKENAFSLAMLYNLAISDAFSFGTGVEYRYTHEKISDDMAGNSANSSTPENATYIDKNTVFDIHLMRPVVGISAQPADAFALNASTSVGFYWGRIDRRAIYSVDRVPVPGGGPNSEALESRDYFGWDIEAALNPTIIVSDTLSFPISLEFYYGSFDYGIDGVTEGYFRNQAYRGVARGPGSIDYDVEEDLWHIMAGLGVVYKMDSYTFDATLSYTYADWDYSYEQVNVVSGAVVFFNGVTSFSQDDSLMVNMLSLDLGMTAEFTENLSTSFGVRYDMGWANKEYANAYDSPFISGAAPDPQFIDAEDTDLFQNLTLDLAVLYKPVNGLTLSLSGMVTMPLDDVEYDMDGSAYGNTVGPRLGYALIDPTTRNLSLETWDYGCMFNLMYEF
ncbi:MAG: hypothetical protein JW885_14615 [Deltaproteobacteria bacterium]|nr:hypothetical protein [Candidatus Zymogenaceae bacterium]